MSGTDTSTNSWEESAISKFNSLQKVKTPRDKKYLEWIKKQPCAVCRKRPPSDPHHVQEEGHGAKGLKTSDYRAIPLCNFHHQQYHFRGRTAFAKFFGLDYELTIGTLNNTYKKEQLWK